MKLSDLEREFDKLAGIGFSEKRRIQEIQVILYRSFTHSIKVKFLDLYTTVSCEIFLNALPDISVDAYAAISYTDRESLHNFLTQRRKLTDQLISSFISSSLTSASAVFFDFTGTKKWHEISAFYKKSLLIRNRAFYERTSGYGPVHFGAGPQDAILF